MIIFPRYAFFEPVFFQSEAKTKPTQWPLNPLAKPFNEKE